MPPPVRKTIRRKGIVSEPASAVSVAIEGPYAPVEKEKKRDTDREHELAHHEKKPDEEGVIGEAERPPPPSEKPEAA